MLVAAKAGVNEIARELGRSASTVSRELAARLDSRGVYRPSVAHADADRRARRPKTGKLAVDQRLREQVEQGLKLRRSPEQISHRLVLDFPDEPEMRVSHETIYQSLFVQGAAS